MIKINPFRAGMFISALILIGACSLNPANTVNTHKADVLTIYPDGSMRLMGKPVPMENVVVYADGKGGEQAAVKVRTEPLHPDYYRGNIKVIRIKPEVSGAGITN